MLYSFKCEKDYTINTVCIIYCDAQVREHTVTPGFSLTLSVLISSNTRWMPAKYLRHMDPPAGLS